MTSSIAQVLISKGFGGQGISPEEGDRGQKYQQGGRQQPYLRQPAEVDQGHNDQRLAAGAEKRNNECPAGTPDGRQGTDARHSITVCVPDVPGDLDRAHPPRQRGHGQHQWQRADVGPGQHRISHRGGGPDDRRHDVLHDEDLFEPDPVPPGLQERKRIEDTGQQNNRQYDGGGITHQDEGRQNARRYRADAGPRDEWPGGHRLGVPVGVVYPVFRSVEHAIQLIYPESRQQDRRQCAPRRTRFEKCRRPAHDDQRGDREKVKPVAEEILDDASLSDPVRCPRRAWRELRHVALRERTPDPFRGPARAR
nr:hypothetical protein [Jidongwangia harbinensis]